MTVGWDDTRNGPLTINGYEGETISPKTFDRLRKEGILGGNVLETHKARRFHPVLRPGEEDGSKLGDLFFREAPYKSEWELEREDASQDVYGTEEVKQTPGDEVHWIPIDPDFKSKLPKGLVLCTNNIKATVPNTDYPPNMTHAWIANLVNRKGKIIGLHFYSVDGLGWPSFTENAAVWGVTHWAPVPMKWLRTFQLRMISHDPPVAKVVQ